MNHFHEQVQCTVDGRPELRPVSHYETTDLRGPMRAVPMTFSNEEIRWGVDGVAHIIRIPE